MFSNIIRRALLALAFSPSFCLALDNGDFSTLSPRDSGSHTYGTSGGVGFLPAWTLLSDDGGILEIGIAPAATGDTVFRFAAPSDRFGDNKLDQCVPIVPDQDIVFSYQLRTNVSPITNDLRVRLNPFFYKDLASCEADLQQNANGGRLDGPLTNADRDVRLGSLSGLFSNQWLQITTATHGETGPMVHAAADIPANARALRLSLRVRDDAADDQRHLWLDDIRVTQGNDPTNRVVNGDFSHRDLADGEELSANQDWYLDRSGNTTLRAGAGPIPEPRVGTNAFYFSSLTGNFGDSKLEQCVLINGDVRPALAVMSPTPDDHLTLRLNVDFYSGAYCDSGRDNSLRLREDFSVVGTPGQWRYLTTTESRTNDDLTGMSSALISIRARDRSADGQPGSFFRPVYIDDVSIDAGHACVHPAVVGAYEVKAFLTPSVVLDSNRKLINTVKTHFSINEAPYRYNLQYLDTNSQDLRGEGWSIRLRKREDQGQHRLQNKKRYTVTGNTTSTLLDAFQDGLSYCTGLEVEVDWGYTGNQTLSFQTNQRLDLSGHTGLDLPDQNDTRASAEANMVDELADWNGAWAASTISSARLYGPIYFERYMGEFEGVELRIEVWHIIDASETGMESLVEVSFKTDNLHTATDVRESLMDELAHQGWLLPQDVLKTSIIMERY